MRSRIILSIFLFALLRLHAQNLVPNPSFENFEQIPCNLYQSSVTDLLYDWYAPTPGSSDAYSDQGAPDCSANATNRGQVPRTGGGVCGIITYGPAYREYLQVQLTSPLTIGKYYYAEMYVSREQFHSYASNNLGMYFSAEPITGDFDTKILPVSPQIKCTEIITDTINWVKISGTFTATEAMQYLTIGNFDTDANTASDLISEIPHTPLAYYFIDDVLVKAECYQSEIVTPICVGTTATLTVPRSTIVNWSLATDPATSISTDPTLAVTPLVNTRYLALNDCGKTSVVDVVLESPGTFQFPASDTSICFTEPMTLDATTPYAHYLWQDGSTNATQTVDTAGRYEVTLTNSCGSYSDEIFVHVDRPSSFTPSDYEICATQIITFDATNYNSSYLWQDSSTNPIYIVDKPGVFAVTIKNSCGEETKTFVVTSCCEDVTIPNLISPNADGMNDNFDVGCYGDGFHELLIYNEWGALVYKNANYNNSWNANNVVSGIYYYYLKNDSEIISKGWLQVLK